MTDKTTALTFSRTIQAPAEHLYYAFTTRSGLQEWFSSMAIVGHGKHNYFYFLWKGHTFASGRIISQKQNQEVTYSFNGETHPHESKVRIQLKEKGAETEVTIEHSQLGNGNQWEPIIADLKVLWEDGLDNLQSVMERGIDLRKYGRPMMGLMAAELVTPESAKKKNLLSHGLLLSGVVHGLGAEKAGLGKGDLIKSIQGLSVEAYDVFDEALEGLSAGDTIEMVYIRDNQEKVVSVVLTERAHPELPSTAQGLSENLAEIFSSANAKLDELFEDVSDAQAEYRPAQGEWNSKEVLAHIIASERDTIPWVSSYLQGKDTFVYSSHLPTRLKAIQVAFPLVPVLREELVRSQDEQVYMLAELPPEFVARKSSYTRLASNILEGTSVHYKDHLQQIEDNLEGALSLGA